MGVTRRYGGRTADERRRDRRARLLAAACAICGEEGWVAVTLRRVCARAGLTDRYFAESFADRDALLIAVFDEAFEEMTQEVGRAVGAAPASGEAQLRAALTTVVAFLANDPRKARILLGRPGGEGAVERHRRQALQDGIARMLEGARPDVDAAAAQVLALIAAGGLSELLNAWLSGALDLDADELVELATRATAALAGPYLGARRRPFATARRGTG